MLTHAILRLGCVLIVVGAGALPGQETAIDVKGSSITIHVGKAGLFSSAGHEHWVEAPITAGGVDESAPRVAFRVETARMQVRPDPKIDSKTQGEIQKDMQEMALETARYPAIEFHSTSVEKNGTGSWRVSGMLALHGVTKPVALTVRHDGGAYTGHTVIRQTDFGIKPIRAAGGLVKVKDELEVDFRIRTQAQ
jgi:polyisoprenoid-binding protein YceI